jgi:hypothetical protein
LLFLSFFLSFFRSATGRKEGQDNFKRAALELGNEIGDLQDVRPILKKRKKAVYKNQRVTPKNEPV